MMMPIKSPCEESAASAAAGAVQLCRGPWVLIATILASSLAFIDGTVVNVGLPALQAALHASVTDIQWVVESYALLLASLLLLGGSLGDLYGRRKIFLYGVALFAIGSSWCGLAPSITSLIVARGLQGIGAALLIPGSLAIIGASYTEDERGRAIGTWSGFTAITASVGPVLGGWLVEHGSWRWVFFINLPMAVIVIVLSLWRVPESRNESASRSMDWLGAALATFGLGAITYALINGSSRGSSATSGHIAVAWGLGVAGIGVLLSFLIVESRSPAPMVSLHLFRSRDFSGANLLTFLLYAPLSGILFFFPLDLIQVQHYTGIGMAISVAPLTTAVMESVPSKEAGVASGVNNAVSRIAGLLAVAVFGLVLSAGFNCALDRRLAQMQLSSSQRQGVEMQRSRLAGAQIGDLPVQHAFDEEFVSGYREVIWVSVGLALLSALSAQMIRSKRSPAVSAKLAS